MATSRLISSHLRRRSSSPLSLLRSFSFLNADSPPSATSNSASHAVVSPSPSTTSFRLFSSYSPDSDLNHEINSDFNHVTNSVSKHDMNSITESELRSLGFFDGSDASAAADAAAAATGGLIEDSIFPVRALVSLLDGFHELTGLPWWIVIASSTVALRFALLPVLILQRQKLKQIADAFPKLPPPLPPPFSGRSYVQQFLLFRIERQAHGCPSFLWFLASHTVMIPCFFLWMGSIRRMSLAGYPGFDTGGILWFQDLTVSASGVLGPVIPFLIACLHFCNIQISFRAPPTDKQTGVLQLLVKWYRKYLEILTIPIFFGAFHVPQGSLVYWVTNSSMTLIQQVCLQHPVISQKLGIPSMKALDASEESVKDTSLLVDTPSKKGAVSVFDYSSLQLVQLSVSYLSTGKMDKAFQLLSLAVEKDPDCYSAWTVLGNVMVEKGLFYKASEYAENAISKISLLGEPYDAQAVDFLIQASMLAGGALYRQGKLDEALVHFDRLKDMEEPEDLVAKARYYEGLVVFASILHNESRSDEAARYLSLAAAFDPQYSPMLENLKLKKDSDDFVDDLASSRRADY